MMIREISHERVRNLGNYESARVTLTAVLEPEDDVQEALATLKHEAEVFLKIPPKKPKEAPTITDDQVANYARHEVADHEDAPTFGGKHAAYDHPDDDIPY